MLKHRHKELKFIERNFHMKLQNLNPNLRIFNFILRFLDLTPISTIMIILTVENVRVMKKYVHNKKNVSYKILINKKRNTL